MKIRIFKIGSLEHKIIPSPELVERLQEILDEWDGDSDLNLAWGPDITIDEYTFGEEK